ncbi:MAG TPA: hypothetical protein VG895_04035 [Patescibacteria group bacterium]|nr:hypothetical protein [Patescibacteria group bacterium]
MAENLRLNPDEEEAAGWVAKMNEPNVSRVLDSLQDDYPDSDVVVKPLILNEVYGVIFGNRGSSTNRYLVVNVSIRQDKVYGTEVKEGRI